LDHYYNTYLAVDSPSVSELSDGLAEMGYTSIPNFPIDSVIRGELSYYDLIQNTTILSDSAKVHVFDLLDLIYSDSGVTLSGLQEIQSSIRNSNLSQNEKDGLLIGISIAYSSQCYWEENLDDWTTRLNSGEIILRGDPGRDIVAADAVTGTGLAIAAGIGVWAPPAGVTVAAGVIGSAAATSAATGIVHGAFWIYDQIGDNTGWW